MQNDKVTVNQAAFSIVLFNFGSSVVMGISTGAGQDTLLAILLAALMTVPVFLLYGRIFSRFPQKDFYDIAEEVLGKVGGKAVTALFTWYSIHLAALVLRNFSEFTQISSMPETPQLPIMVLMVLTTVFLARSGMHAIGKWSVVSFFLLGAVVTLTFIPSLYRLRFDDLLPLMEHPPALIAKTGFQIFSFPFAETVVFLCLGGSFTEGKPYKTLFRALTITLIIFLLVFIRNLVLLGRSMMEISVFPSYVTARIIEVSDFLSGIEGFISSNFLLAGIVKISVCLLAAGKGLSRLFGLKHHPALILPAGLLAMGLGATVYQNTMDMFAFTPYYPYYAFPFQVVLPLAVLIVGEVRLRRRKGGAALNPTA